MAAELGRLLGDSWTLFRGYRNRRGEIDHLLLGPRGLFAIEVKNLNATVHIDGDRWRADKYDRYGNLVEVSASRLDRDQRAAIADLIRRDHAFHGKRPPTARPGRSRRTPSR